MHMSSMTQMHCQRIQRAAIALNNAAVFLLSSHQYHNALETFKDSVALMRATVTHVESEGSCAPPQQFSERESDEMLRNAWQRNASSCPEAKKDARRDDIVVLKISSQEDPGRVHDAIERMKDTVEGSVQLKTFCCITIEPVDFEDVHAETFDLYGNLLLYNYAVAHTVLAAKLASLRREADCKLVERLRESGFHLFLLSESFLVSRLESSLFDVMSGTVLVVNLLLASVMSQLAFQLNYTDMSIHYSSNYTFLLATIDTHQKLFPLQSQQAGAA